MYPAHHRFHRPRRPHLADERTSRAAPAWIVALLVAGTAVLGACGDAGPTAPASERAASLQLAADTVDLARPGDDRRLEATVRDSSGRELQVAAELSWSVDDTVTARLGPAADTALARVVPGARVAILLPADSALRTWPGDTAADSVAGGPRLDSAAVDPGGSLDLRAPRPLAGDTVDLWVDQRPAARRTHLPSAWHDVALEPGFRVDALLVPAAWTIRRGELEGREVGVSLQRIFGYPNAWDSGNYFAVWKDNWSSWRAERRGELPPDTVPGDALEVRYAVRVEVVDLEGRGAATAFLDSPAYPVSDLIGAFVAIGSTAYVDDSTVPHELTHALGYYHACFPSSVDHCIGPYPFQHLPTVTDAVHPSQYDVAYMELLRTAHPELLRRAPNFGLVAALNGERVHLLGLPPVAESWLGGPAPVARRPIR